MEYVVRSRTTGNSKKRKDGISKWETIAKGPFTISIVMRGERKGISYRADPVRNNFEAIPVDTSEAPGESFTLFHSNWNMEESDKEIH